MVANAPWKTAWITGASSGIGRELALQLARRGVRVAASARSTDKLEELARSEPNIVAVPVDVTDRTAMAAAAARIATELGPIDLAILNAGIWHPMGARAYDAERAINSMAINYNGVVHALEAILPSMIARSTGRIAFVSSVAGYRGLPKAAAYAPTKAAIISLAESLHHDLSRLGIGVTIVNPAFVDTPMTRINKFPMPFIVSAEDAAGRIIAGMERGKFEIAFPWQLVLQLKLARVVPYWLFYWYVRTFLTAPSRNGG